MLQFCLGKQCVLSATRAHFGETVYVPRFFTEHDFEVTSEEQREELLKTLNRSGGTWTRACDYVCSRLSIIRLPVQREGRWRVALLPNIVGASDADVSVQVGMFYELLEKSEQLLGDSLSAEQVASLKAVLPPGSGMRTLVDYLIAKFAPDATRLALGYTRNRAERLVARYDIFVSERHATREAAYLKVSGKVIKRTGEEIKDLKRATEHEMQRLVQKEHLLQKVARRARVDGGGWKSEEDFITIIKDVVRGMGEASSKGATGATPEDADILEKAQKAFGIAGGKVDRIYQAVRAAVIARFGRDVSRTTVYNCFVEAGIKFAGNVPEMALVLHQHYCRARVLLYVWFFLCFSAWSIVLSIDQKALYKANCDRHKGKEIQIMSERARWAVTDKGAGYDTLCSLALFSIWLLPWRALSVEMAARVGLSAFMAKMVTAFGYDSEEVYGERDGCAAAYGYIAAVKGLNSDECEPESSARNQGAVDKFCTEFHEFCAGPDGMFVPLVLFILDNSKGPADKDFAFCLGLFFFIRNLDVAAAVSPAGKCSYEVPVEKVNGALARRLKGVMIRFKAECIDKMAAALSSLWALCYKTDVATFSGGGGHVDVKVASEVKTAFPWDAVEIKAFLAAKPAGRVDFNSRHEQQWPGISDLYRKVFLYQMGTNSDGYVLFSRDSGSCMWRKREGCSAHEPWRGPRGMRLLLDLWPRGVPPPLCPQRSVRGLTHGQPSATTCASCTRTSPPTPSTRGASAMLLGRRASPCPVAKNRARSRISTWSSAVCCPRSCGRSCRRSSSLSARQSPTTSSTWRR